MASNESGVSMSGSAYPDAQAEITALYQQVLGRDPDAGGLAYWNGLLTRGATRQDVVSGIRIGDKIKKVTVA